MRLESQRVPAPKGDGVCDTRTRDVFPRVNIFHPRVSQQKCLAICQQPHTHTHTHGTRTYCIMGCGAKIRFHKVRTIFCQRERRRAQQGRVSFCVGPTRKGFAPMDLNSEHSADCDPHNQTLQAMEALDAFPFPYYEVNLST